MERRVKAAWRQKRPEGSGGGRPHPRLFCWKAYTLALTQSGVALHWHASKTAPPDAELGGLPGDVARVDGAEDSAGETKGLGEGVSGWVSDSDQGDVGERGLAVGVGHVPA
jgi:hypothetical protein